MASPFVLSGLAGRVHVKLTAFEKLVAVVTAQVILKLVAVLDRVHRVGAANAIRGDGAAEIIVRHPYLLVVETLPLGDVEGLLLEDY